MNLAVIPARGGSKRLPRKNIREFAGVPMLARSIETAHNAKLFDRIIVSTDDEEIASIALESGAEIPFMRPAHLSGDSVGTVPVIAHATQHMTELGSNPDYVCCIYPCTPFVKPVDLQRSHKLIEETGEDFVYPVLEYAHPTFRAMRRDANSKMSFVFPECEMMRTQDLDVTYHDAGQFYWGKAEAWLENKRMHTAGIGMPVPAWRFVDVDTEDDWRRAELLYKVMADFSE